MSLTDNSAKRSIGPSSVYSTVPSGGGAFGRGPLGPSLTGRPPTRSGLKSMDVARPLITVGVHAVSNNAAHAIASANRAFTRLYPLSVPNRLLNFAASTGRQQED